MKTKYVPLIVSLFPVIVIVIILASVLAALGGSPTVSTDAADKYKAVAGDTGVPWDILILTDMCLAGYDDTNNTYDTNYTNITYDFNDINSLNPLDTALNFLILTEVKETRVIVGYENTSGEAITTEAAATIAASTDPVTTPSALTPIYGWVYSSSKTYSGKAAILKYAGLSQCSQTLTYASLKVSIQQAAVEKGGGDNRYTVTVSVNANYLSVLWGIGITPEDAASIIESHNNGDLNE